ncbi:ATP-binding protein [Streptomyces profundus]|uniref:ATP-binding protein n=1 Tax=Streptomyces profundus TaxID=2867410 RepID=UPI001D163BCB|nr:ATP-binding protein [Streptomyces sp. MA3_2.13]UED85154.1 ATP-binding protein [Streptomyces sp. MA3_2.13]
MTNAALAVVLLAATAALGAVGCALWLRRRDAERLRAMEARVATAGTGERIAVRRLAAVTAELRRLAEDRIPAAALALNHPNAPVPAPPRATEMGPDEVRALDEALDAVLAAVVEERERVDAAARAAMRGATAKVQSLLYQIQSLLHDLQHEYDDPRLLELDFRNELALRRIQATAVLCEAWPGLARTDSPLAEIVRGAQSRVPGYARVKVANHLREPRTGVVARAAEPLAISLAELLANATAYSHPETEVPVTLQQGGGGSVFVVIDDAGVGMDDDTLARARRLLTSPDGVLLTELGNPPQAGFAVVGRLAGQYGFTCHVEPSPYGGIRAMLRVPADVLTAIEDDHTLSVLAPEPVPSRREVAVPSGREVAPRGPAAAAVGALGTGPGILDITEDPGAVSAGAASRPGEGSAGVVAQVPEDAEAGVEAGPVRGVGQPTDPASRPERGASADGATGAAVASRPGQAAVAPDPGIRRGQGPGAGGSIDPVPGPGQSTAATASGEGSAASDPVPGPGQGSAASDQPTPPGQGSVGPPTPSGEGAVVGVGRGVGLPSRRRRVARAARPARSAPAAERSPEEADARWSALQQGTRLGRSAAGDSAVGDRDDMGGDGS